MSDPFPEEFIENVGQYLDEEDWCITQYKVTCPNCSKYLIYHDAKDWDYCPYCGHKGLDVQTDLSGYTTLRDALTFALEQLKGKP